LNGEYSFFGIFDGTVQDYASDWICRHLLDELLAAPSFREYHSLSMTAKNLPANRRLLEAACCESYQSADSKLIALFAQRDIHYSSCTSVTVLIHHPTSVMYVAHLGDSHVVAGIEKSRSVDESGIPLLEGRSLTRPHKPNDPDEQKRIEDCGGSVVYLKSGKPFLRGGDFFQRQLAMQLNYSRAFGGKDLKMYGLSCTPSVLQLRYRAEQKTASDDTAFYLGELKCLILGSDGVWDVSDPTNTVNLAARSLDTYHEGLSLVTEQRATQLPATPSEMVVHVALENHALHGSSDNVTAIVVFFR